jgi:alpha-glucosidase
MSRTGLPIVRPLFLEFPSATADGHPLDLDAPNQFMFGPDLLVAPFRFPDELDSYDVILPPGNWYDYWTGARVNGTTKIQPRLDVLPVYARAGSIIPMQPLTQSTAEIPKGPLTLRVYPGPKCSGSMYSDDGTTLDYHKGEYLRIKFSCQVSGDGLQMHLGAPEGSYPAWWKEYEVQVFGWSSRKAHVLVNGKAAPSVSSSVDARRVLTLRLPAAGEADLQISPTP